MNHFKVYLTLLLPVLTHHMLEHDAPTLRTVIEGPGGQTRQLE